MICTEFRYREIGNGEIKAGVTLMQDFVDREQKNFKSILITWIEKKHKEIMQLRHITYLMSIWGIRTKVQVCLQRKKILLLFRKKSI